MLKLGLNIDEEDAVEDDDIPALEEEGHEESTIGCD